MVNINEEQKRQYVEEGFMIVPDFLSPDELKNVREACDVSIREIEEDMYKRGIKEDRINVLNSKYFINNARDRHHKLKEVIFGDKIRKVCAAVIGNTAYLHNEQFVVKMTDTATSFAWHQDSGYSVYQGGAQAHKSYLTCWIALDDMSSQNGTISVLPFSRSPSRELIEHYWDKSVNAMVGYQGEDPGDLVEVKAGTLVAFSSFLLHKSGANQTSRPRRSYFIAYTSELFTHADASKGIYSSGEPLMVGGERKD